ncbi:MAG: hypothetical protein K6T91_08485 [Firmicutes bacterium]|nr:hypothetical protein [Bacillota bacterium]
MPLTAKIGFIEDTRTLTNGILEYTTLPTSIGSVINVCAIFKHAIVRPTTKKIDLILESMLRGFIKTIKDKKTKKLDHMCDMYRIVACVVFRNTENVKKSEKAK